MKPLLAAQVKNSRRTNSEPGSLVRPAYRRSIPRALTDAVCAARERFECYSFPPRIKSLEAGGTKVATSSSAALTGEDVASLGGTARMEPLTNGVRCLPYDASTSARIMRELRHVTGCSPEKIATFLAKLRKTLEEAPPVVLPEALPSASKPRSGSNFSAPNTSSLLDALGEQWEDRMDAPISVSATLGRRRGLFGEVGRKELHHHVISILNRVTNDAEKYREIKNELLRLPIPEANDTMLEKIVDVFFQKAVREQHFSNSYADLVVALCKVPEGQRIVGDKSQSLEYRLRQQLLTRCQLEFVQLEQFNLELAQHGEEVRGKDSEEESFKERRDRSCGILRFVGELFLRHVVTGKVIENILFSALTGPSGQLRVPPPYKPTEAQMDEVITVLNITDTVFFKTPLGAAILSDFTGVIRHWSVHHPVPRIRFLLLSVLERLQRIMDERTADATSADVAISTIPTTANASSAVAATVTVPASVPVMTSIQPPPQQQQPQLRPSPPPPPSTPQSVQPQPPQAPQLLPTPQVPLSKQHPRVPPSPPPLSQPLSQQLPPPPPPPLQPFQQQPQPPPTPYVVEPPMVMQSNADAATRVQSASAQPLSPCSDDPRQESPYASNDRRLAVGPASDTPSPKMKPPVFVGGKPIPAPRSAASRNGSMSMSMNSAVNSAVNSTTSLPNMKQIPTAESVARIMLSITNSTRNLEDVTAEIVASHASVIPVAELWTERCLTVVKAEKDRALYGSFLASLNHHYRGAMRAELRQVAITAFTGAVRQKLYEELRLFKFWTEMVCSNPTREVLDEDLLNEAWEHLLSNDPNAVRFYLRDVSRQLQILLDPSRTSDESCNFVRYRPLRVIHSHNVSRECDYELQMVNYKDVRCVSVEVDVFCTLITGEPSKGDLFDKIRSMISRRSPVIAPEVLSGILHAELCSNTTAYLEENMDLLHLVGDGPDREKREVLLVAELYMTLKNTIGEVSRPLSAASRVMAKMNANLITDETRHRAQRYFEQRDEYAHHYVGTQVAQAPLQIRVGNNTSNNSSSHNNTNGSRRYVPTRR